MHLALYFWDRLPVSGYGGTQRAVVWLARGLAELGHEVTLIAGIGTRVPEARVVEVDLDAVRRPGFDIAPFLPPGVDLLYGFAPVPGTPPVPYIRRLAGNWRAGKIAPPNTLFLSANHAARHGGRSWVYNGVDPSEFVFRSAKDRFDLFLGRLHSVKGHRLAIDGTRRLDRRLVVAGGWRPSFPWSRVRYHRTVGGTRKAQLLAAARCLWMPAQWHEPFGLTLIEALVSGTPVIGTHFGSLPEIIRPSVGGLGDTLEELVEVARSIERVDPAACRARVERYFSHRTMAEGYLRVARHYLESGALPTGVEAGD
jgi:glycosyltransferase involved in cell wall biosynthesis